MDFAEWLEKRRATHIAPSQKIKRDRNKPLAFMSYVQSDDQYEWLSEFRKRLSAAVRMHTGEDFPIFQDIHIRLGEDWKNRLLKTLDEVYLLIPIITPSYFKSTSCRMELDYFHKRELTLQRDDLIIPIYYVNCDLLNDEVKRATDPLAQLIASRQYDDWRELRFEPFTARQVQRRLAQLAGQIANALERVRSHEKLSGHSGGGSSAPKTDVQSSGPGSVDVPSAETQPEIVGSPYSKNVPPTLVVDQQQRGDYSTIREAIEAANPGDRIVVLPGLYEENLLIDKTLEILGMGPRDQIILQAQSQNTVSFKTNLGRIVNLSLRQSGGSERFGVDIAQGHLELEGCDISSESFCCIGIHGGAKATIRHNQIHGAEASGIYIFDNGEGIVEENEIDNNKLAGVAITKGGKGTLRINRVHNNGREGIIIYEDGQALIEDNKIYRNAYSAVEIRTDSVALLRHNHIYDGKSGGIYVHSDAQATIEHNDVFGNMLAGVAIKTGANPTLRGNLIHDGKQSGVFITENGKAQIEDNEIFGNAYSGVEIKTGGDATIRRNRINKNGHLGTWIGEGGGATVENNDLRDNVKGAFYIAPESSHKVNRTGNLGDNVH